MREEKKKKLEHFFLWSIQARKKGIANTWSTTAKCNFHRSNDTNPLNHSAVFFFFFFVLHIFHFSIESFIQRLKCTLLRCYFCNLIEELSCVCVFYCELIVMSVSFEIVIATSFGFKNVVCGCEIEATKTKKPLVLVITIAHK